MSSVRSGSTSPPAGKMFTVARGSLVRHPGEGLVEGGRIGEAQAGRLFGVRILGHQDHLDAAEEEHGGVDGRVDVHGGLGSDEVPTAQVVAHQTPGIPRGQREGLAESRQHGFGVAAPQDLVGVEDDGPPLLGHQGGDTEGLHGLGCLAVGEGGGDGHVGRLLELDAQLLRAESGPEAVGLLEIAGHDALHVLVGVVDGVDYEVESRHAPRLVYLVVEGVVGEIAVGHPFGRDQAEVVALDGVPAGHAGKHQLRSPAEAVPGMREYGAQGDAQVGAGEQAVDEHLPAEGQRAHRGQVVRATIVVDYA